jgi:hypothetical protein
MYVEKHFFQHPNQGEFVLARSKLGSQSGSMGIGSKAFYRR